MRVVITGGAGFIGSNLCRRLLETPGRHEIVVIDDLSLGRRDNLDGLTVDVVEGSILDVKALDEAFAGADAVVHLAAIGSVPRSVENPVASHDANATGTMLVLEAARRHGGLHTIVASSSSVYGANPALPKNENLVPMPVSPYAASKLATEQYALAWSRTYGLPVLPFRFFNVFGPRQRADHAYAAVIPAFVDAALHGRPAVVHGDGTQSRDFTFVGTVCAVIDAALAGSVTSDGPINLAFGSRLTLLDVLSTLEGVLGHAVERQHGPARVGDVAHSMADAARLHEAFTDIAPTPFLDGLTQTVDWMRHEIDNTR